MNKVVIHGGGLVGRAIALDLRESFEVVVVDKDPARIDVLSREGGLEVVEADLRGADVVETQLEGADLAIGALPGDVALGVLARVIDAGCPAVDIATFEDDPQVLAGRARERGVPVVVDAGVAPGLANLIAGHHAARGDVAAYDCVIGSLPAARELPLGHRDHYPSLEALSECVHPATVIRGGESVTLAPLAGSALVDVPQLGTLQSFPVAALGTLAETIAAPSMVVRAVRYPEHFELLRTWLDAGLLSSEPREVGGAQVCPIEVTAACVEQAMALGEHDRDWLVLQVRVEQAGEWTLHELICDYDAEHRVSALSRATAAPCSGIARLLLDGSFAEAGMHVPETLGRSEVHFAAVMRHLEACGVRPKVASGASAAPALG